VWEEGNKQYVCSKPQQIKACVFSRTCVVVALTQARNLSRVIMRLFLQIYHSSPSLQYHTVFSLNTMEKKAFSALRTCGTDLEGMLVLYWRISGINFLFLTDPVCSLSGEGKEFSMPWLQWPSGFTMLKII